MPGDQTTARDAVLAAVKAGEWRSRRHRLIVELSRASVLAACVPAVTAAIRVVRPVSPAALTASLLIPAVLLAAWVAWRLRRHAALERVAHEMDAAAGLNDELLSAHWFASHGPDTPWTGAQVGRAAARISDVDWDAMQPAPRPRRAWATAAVLLGVTVILLFVPTGTLGGPARLTAGSAAGRDVTEAIEILRTRLEETGMSDADRLRAAEILNALQREGLSAEEARALLAELEKLLGTDGLDAKTLEAMADALDKSASAKELADALRRHAMAEAAKKARELADKAAGLGKQERDELAEAMEQAAARGATSDRSLQELADEMREAADMLRGDDGQAMKKSLEQMADRMEQVAKDAQEKGAGAARDQTEALEEALGEKPGEPGEKGDSRSESSSASGQQQSMGEGMAREAAAAPNTQMAQQATMPGLGQMAGQPQAQPPPSPQALAEGKRRIEVALKEEMVRAHDEAADSKPAELIDRKTERVDSTVQYRRVEGAQDYDRAKAQQEGSVPEARRAVVKKYFTALGPRSKNKKQ